MRFGILNQKEEVALAKKAKPEFDELHLGIVRKKSPEVSDGGGLARWILQSLGIVNDGESAHPAVDILLELVKKRKGGQGATGAELTALTNIGKTQTYYWLNKMKGAGIVCQGKKKLIEHGAIRTLSGFYLTGPNLSYTLADVKKRVGESFDEMIGVSERLQEVLTAMESVDPEGMGESEGDTIPQPDNIPTPQKS